MTAPETVALFQGIPRGLRVLCVEDEVMIAEMVEFVLGEHLRMEVETAASGREALALLEHRRFDLLIVDVLMPEMSGKELYREMEALYPEVLPRILFTTGDTLTESTLAFVASTGRKLLKKPFGLPEFMDMLREVLSTPSGIACN